MRSRVALRLPALVLAALTAAMSSGLPTHHHDDAADGGPVLADAGHHGHGTVLVDQSDRQTSQPSGNALPATAVVDLVEASKTTVAPSAMSSRLVATGRSPPSSRPRAPPVSV